MPTKLPNPRATFNYYLDVQEDMDFALRKVLSHAVDSVDYDIANAVGDAVGQKITRAQSLAVKKALHARLAVLYKEAGYTIQGSRMAAVAAGVKAFGEYEQVLLRAAMPQAAIDAYIQSSIATSEAGIEAVMQRIYGKSYNPLSYSVYQTEKLSGGMVDRLVENSLAKGVSARQLASEVKSMINPNVRGGVSYAAQRLARTEINNAFHAASIDRYERSPYVTGVDWNLSGSHPEGDLCDWLAMKSPYDKKHVPAKPHPMCFCFITPEVMSEDEFLDTILGPDKNVDLLDDLDENGSISLREKFEAGWERDITLSRGTVSGAVNRIKFSDGSYGVVKMLSGHGSSSILEEANRELLSSQLARYLGVRSPKVAIIRDGDGVTSLLSEFVEGYTFNDWLYVERTTSTNEFGKDLITLFKSGDSGATETLAFDMLFGNADRHGGNLIVTQAEKLVAIDHGLMKFNGSRMHPVVFEQVLQEDGLKSGWAPAWQKLEPEWRAKLTAARPLFEKFGKTDFYDNYLWYMFKQLNHIAEETIAW